MLLTYCYQLAKIKNILIKISKKENPVYIEEKFLNDYKKERTNFYMKYFADKDIDIAFYNALMDSIKKIAAAYLYLLFLKDCTNFIINNNYQMGLDNKSKNFWQENLEILDYICENIELILEPIIEQKQSL